MRKIEQILSSAALAHAFFPIEAVLALIFICGRMAIYY